MEEGCEVVFLPESWPVHCFSTFVVCAHFLPRCTTKAQVHFPKRYMENRFGGDLKFNVLVKCKERLLMFIVTDLGCWIVHKADCG